ncbi:MAG: AAA family ATPase [Rhabdochlamydiaceae bacterium]|nr:AAA family ATPase [Rhabdochlamydiaceae bacterium]
MIRIFIFGPSCSGKSTLAEALQKKWGPNWTRIDRDDLSEAGCYSEMEANALLDQKIQTIKDNFIIDAQIPWREKKEGECYFLVLPPLGVLIQRDEKRAAFRQRSEKRAEYARKYVITTHAALSQMDPKSFDACLDSSVLSLEEEISKVEMLIDKLNKVRR